MASTARSNVWSITTNNPTDEDMKPTLPPGWKFEGQVETGESGTTHIQAMLCTPQVRFSAVKRYFPRSHIEICRDKKALQAYVHKEETRVAELPKLVSINIFTLRQRISAIWDTERYTGCLELWNYDRKKALMSYVDSLISDIIDTSDPDVGLQIAMVASNPAWRTCWLKFGYSLIRAAQRIEANKNLE